MRVKRGLWAAFAAAAGLHPVPTWGQEAEGPSPASDAGGEAILVTGTRLPRPSEDNPSPTQTVGREDFVLTGVPNVEQTLNQLPQLAPTFTNTSNNPGTGGATLSLRGLGSVRTLILVNGRRWIASDAGQTPEVDVNTIPAALIERVDVVTGGASAVYGSDAVTGVINFILDTELEGLWLEARQNVTEAGDGRVSAVDFSFGTRFAGDRGRIVASIGGLDQAPVTYAQRSLSRVALQDGCGVPGTRDETGASVPVRGPCIAPNEVTLIAGGSPNVPEGRISGQLFFPAPGGALVPTTPLGVLFDRDGRPRPFDLAVDLYNFAPENYLQVGLRRWSGNLLASFDASSGFRPYVEAALVLTRSPQQLASVPATVLDLHINLDNPFLTPEARQLLEINFGVDAEGDRGFVGTPATGLAVNPAFDGDADGFVTIAPLPFVVQSRLGLGPRRIVNRREAVRGLLGVTGELPARWIYDVYYGRSRVEHRADRGNSGSAARLRQAVLARRDPVTGQIACIDPDGGCVPASIFGIGNLSAEAADFIRTHPRDLTIIEEQVAEASLRGELALLPAGPAGLALGATWRRTGYDFRPDPALFTGDDLGFLPGVPAAGSTRVWELFGEARVPLLRGLSAELGLRWSRYDTVGGVWTWKALGQWEATGGLRLRGGWQRAVRAPNARELFEEATTSVTFVRDPCGANGGLLGDPQIQAACLRNGVLPGQSAGIGFDSFVPFAERGGRADLEAETALSFTLGGVLAPARVPGMSITIDYYDIRIEQAIGRFGGGEDFVVFGCIRGGADPADPLCAAYTRGPNGAVATIALPTANQPEIRARGIDWQLAFARNVAWQAFGGRHRLDVQLAGTRYLDNSFTPNENLPPFECAGLFGSPCGNTISGAATPRWKLHNRATWTGGPFSLTLRHRWFSSTGDGRLALAEYLGIDPPLLPDEGRRLESRNYFDLAVTVLLGERFRFTLGANNLTDAKPAITGLNQVQANTDPSLYDMLGRRFFVALSARLD